MSLALAQSALPLRADPPSELLPGSSLDAPNPALLARLEQEHVVCNESDGRTARALVLFQQPLDEVWTLLTSTTRQKEYRPELTGLTVVDSGDHSNVADYSLRFMLTSLHYRLQQGWDSQSRRVWWSLDPSFDNDMRVLDGLWELRPLDESHTLARFSTRIDIGPALPAFLQDYATRKKLPESMDHVRRWVDSGGAWRP
ncbi:MAG TPA: hypothetical protein VMS55_15655 [Myxococcota bacterium]|nr:hypothetical protein [Myxococcota bacterium]